ncbi:hypothetical protein L6452_27365 [Arctium lappa]|uniref:Uncharacterized protein n=1 Tax=Arctium lappa TaxID=4217 RepID=A0ACB9A0J5_ARCLA|nr:hypothetical protein L6452_27365 [Arctium lappa]
MSSSMVNNFQVKTPSIPSSSSQNLIISRERVSSYQIINDEAKSREFECLRIFQEYFTYAQSTHGQTDSHLSSSVSDHLKSGLKRYMEENPGRSLDGYIDLLEELQSMSKEKIESLQN